MAHIMIIDASEANGAKLERLVHEQLGASSVSYVDGYAACNALELARGSRPDVVLYNFQRAASAPVLVEALRAIQPDLAVIPIVSDAMLDLAQEAVERGATNFLISPFYPEQLRQMVSNALHMNELRQQAHLQVFAGGNAYDLEETEAVSAVMKSTLYMARSITNSPDSLLLEGARGAGKEWLARMIHATSLRRYALFVPVNLALVESQAVEPLLFGENGKAGAFAAAKEGTLFIRGIEQLSENGQHRLVELWKQQGPAAPRLIFVREAASGASASGAQFVQQNTQLSQSLYRELQVLPILVPALRERSEDIPNLVQRFVARYAALLGKVVDGVEEETLEMLAGLSWPGNVVQLGNAVYVAVALANNRVLGTKDFSHVLMPDGGVVTALERSMSSPLQRKSGSERSVEGFARDAQATAIEGVMSVLDERGNIRSLCDLEQELIKIALARYSGHMSKVARHLGIGRSTLYRKVAGMEAPR